MSPEVVVGELGLRPRRGWHGKRAGMSLSV